MGFRLVHGADACANEGHDSTVGHRIADGSADVGERDHRIEKLRVVGLEFRSFVLTENR